MALVSYSDSEGSNDETPQTSPRHNSAIPSPAQPSTSFAIDKSNPRKIQVKLPETNADTSNNVAQTNDEPAPKRQRTSGGAFSGFNSILPAPKRDSRTQNSSGSAKGHPRKIFSLRTGPERGFDRESDSELKLLFTEQHAAVTTSNTNGTENGPVESILQSGFGAVSTLVTPKTGRQMMFKPLSVARKPQKKKKSTKEANVATTEASVLIQPAADDTPKPKPKISLFSTNSDLPSHVHSAIMTTEYEPMVCEVAEENGAEPTPDLIFQEVHSSQARDDAGRGELNAAAGPQSLDVIATDLNLSASARRQLFGRKSGTANNAVNIINFNIDQEYAANEVIRASGEQIQHTPVRAPASGKHSLRQLVSLATGQKDALEESFATGRKNKKEAESKYGW